MALYIASMVSSQWLDNYGSGVQRSHGPFEACVQDWKNNVHECRRVDNSCTSDFSDPLGTEFVGSDCDKTRVVRAFLILGLLFSAMAFVPAWLGYNSYDDILYRIPAILLSLTAMACGLIAWAVWTAMAQQHYGSEWNYGWGYGLALGAWLLNLATPIALMVPSPARDAKTGELLARDTMAGRRGTWADMLKASWWTGGTDWGGREAARAGGYAGGPGGAAAGYESRGAPAGTSYRDEPHVGYSYRGSEHGRGAPLHTERSVERGSLTGETERERLDRESRMRSSEAGRSWLGHVGEKMGLGGGTHSSTHASETAPSTMSTAERGYGGGHGYGHSHDAGALGAATSSAHTSSRGEPLTTA